MKRQFLNVLLILLLILTMFILTGCGADEKSVEETSNSEVKDSEETEKHQETTNIETTVTSEMITSDNYGENIEYSAGGVDDWKIFYSDGTYVYIIASDYLNTSLIPSSAEATTERQYLVWWENPSATSLNSQSRFMYSKLSEVDTDSANCYVVAKLLNNDIWANFVNTDYAEYAVGSPTLEMWIASWNEKGYTKLYTDVNSAGYCVGTEEIPTTSYVDLSIDDGSSDTLYFPYQDIVDECKGYWLASPSVGGSSFITYVSVEFYEKINTIGYFKEGYRN